MKGSIRRRSKNSWELSIDLGRDQEGQRKRKFLNVKGKKSDAERKLREFLSSVDKGIPIDHSKETLREYLLDWHAGYAIPNTRPRTADRYMTDIRNHLIPLLGDIPVTKLTSAHIQTAEGKMLAKGLSNRSVLHAHRVLGQALKHAVEKGHIWRNPCDMVRAPKIPSKSVEVPEPETVKSILEKTKDTLLYPAFYLLAFTGARRGEISALRWSDIDFQGRTISINRSAASVKGKGVVMSPPKTESGKRNIAIDEFTVDVLRRHSGTQLIRNLENNIQAEQAGYLFTDALGRPIDPYILTDTWRKLISKMNVPKVRLHDLRHFHASFLLRSNTHPKVVQERLGHSSISVTLDTYSHSVPSLQREAADIFANQMQQIDVSVDQE